MAFILALSKRIVYWDQQTKTDQWNTRYDSMNDDLEGATLGIVGFGNIGEIVIMQPHLYMRILVYDPYIPKEAAEALGVELTSLEELFASAKYISLHTTLTPETR